MEHVLKLVAAQSTATIGSVTRAWLCVMGVLWGSLGSLIVAFGAQEIGDRIASAIGAGFLFSAALSVPVMAVLAIIHIARNW